MFKKATKQQCKLRLAIMGVSGAGKTYSALRIAKGIGGKIALLDTERKSASKYSDRFDFDVAELESAKIDNVIDVIEQAGKAGYTTLVIDSLTHAWQELLEEIDRLTKAKYSGNSFRAWSEGTPKQKRLINAILNSPCHIIATMRAKTDYIITTNDKGKATPQRVGTGAEQGKGIEYEFDMLIDISQEHIANVLKDRTGKFQDALIDKPDETFGADLAKWLDDGEFIPQTQLKAVPDQVKHQSDEKITGGQVANLKIELKDFEALEKQIKAEFKIESFKDLPASEWQAIKKRVQELKKGAA